MKEHQKRLKKEAKKMRSLGIAKKAAKNENRIPNLYPFKKKMIEALERKRKNEDNERKAKLLREKEEQAALDEMTLVESLNKAVVYESQLQAAIVAEEKKENDNKHNNKKFYRELNQVLTASDVLVSSENCRNPALDHLGSLGCQRSPCL